MAKIGHSKPKQYSNLEATGQKIVKKGTAKSKLTYSQKELQPRPFTIKKVGGKDKTTALTTYNPNHYKSQRPKGTYNGKPSQYYKSARKFDKAHSYTDYKHKGPEGPGQWVGQAKIKKVKVKSNQELRNQHMKQYEADLKQQQSEKINKETHATAKRLSRDLGRQRHNTVLANAQSKEKANKVGEAAMFKRAGAVAKQLNQNQHITHRLLTDKSLTPEQKESIKNSRTKKESLEKPKAKANKEVYGKAYPKTEKVTNMTVSPADYQNNVHQVKQEKTFTSSKDDKRATQTRAGIRMLTPTQIQHMRNSVAKQLKDQGHTKAAAKSGVVKKYNQIQDAVNTKKGHKHDSQEEAVSQWAKENRQKYFGSDKIPKKTAPKKKNIITEDDW